MGGCECVCARACVRVSQGQEIRSGNRMSCLSRIIAPRSFRSRYSLVVSYARNTACMRHRGLPQTQPSLPQAMGPEGSATTPPCSSEPRAWTVVKSRGELRTKFVNMNSNREPLNLVRTYSACVVPRSREFAVRMFIEIIEA